MSALDVILLVIILSAVVGALRYIIKRKKSGGCVGCSGCSGCSKSCQMNNRCGHDNIDSSSIHIKRASLQALKQSYCSNAKIKTRNVLSIQSITSFSLQFLIKTVNLFSLLRLHFVFKSSTACAVAGSGLSVSHRADFYFIGMAHSAPVVAAVFNAAFHRHFR